MPKVAISQRSRLRFAALVEVDGRTFWDLPLVPEIPPRDDDEYHQWDEMDTFEGLAGTRYGDVSLKWVIARRNGFFDMPFDVKMGDVIALPSRKYVSEVLFGKR